MKCSKCNTENNYYHKYCYNCGERLPVELPKADTDEENNLSAPPVFLIEDEYKKRRKIEHSKKKKRKKVLKTIIIVTILLVVAFAIVYIANPDTVKEWFGPSETLVVTTPAPSEAAPLTFAVKNSGALETQSEEYALAVETNASRLYINGAETEIALQANGTQSVTLKLASIGDNRFVLKAEDAGGNTKEETVVVKRLASKVVLALTDGQTLSTQAGKIAVTGKCSRNAVISVATELKYDPAVFDDAGNFSITFYLPITSGKFTVKVAAKAADMDPAEISFTIEKQLNESEYIAASVVGVYIDMKNQPEIYSGKVVKAGGIVKTIEQTNGVTKILLYKDGLSTRPMTIEYSGTQTLQAGNDVLFYGELTGVRDGLPCMSAQIAVLR